MQVKTEALFQVISPIMAWKRVVSRLQEFLSELQCMVSWMLLRLAAIPYSEVYANQLPEETWRLVEYHFFTHGLPTGRTSLPKTCIKMTWAIM